MSKKSIVIVLVVILALAGGFYYLNSQKSPVDTTQVNKVEYKNSEYGFNFELPDNWKGFTLVNDTWKGYNYVEPQGQVLIEQGPQISIRNPIWTEKEPTQDIPIMIFTIKQWDEMSQDKFHIGAAPIGPRELGRNTKYVFALPARYNFAYPKGVEEVESIINSGALKPQN